MVAQFVATLERPIARVRLENYRDGGSDFDMVVNYFYNIELSEALYPTLHAFEVALRNSVHSVLTRHFQTPYWFDHPGFLPNRQVKQVVAARDKLTKSGKLHDADRIVAELNFGFWHSMFNSPFERHVWRPNRSALILQAFPQIPRRQRSRQDVWSRCDRIRIIRNRVMHFEPILFRSHLDDDHAEILEALRWISIEMHDTIAICDRFPSMRAHGRYELAQRIGTEIRRRDSPSGTST